MMKTAVQPSATRERSIVIGLAAAVAVLVALYLGLRSSVFGGGTSGTLMPYQMLVRDFVSADQTVFARLRDSLIEAETVRSQTGRWPEASQVPSLNAAGTVDGAEYKWVRTQRNIVINYLGLPDGDVSAAAWLLRI